MVLHGTVFGTFLQIDWIFSSPSSDQVFEVSLPLLRSSMEVCVPQVHKYLRSLPRVFALIRFTSAFFSGHVFHSGLQSVNCCEALLRGTVTLLEEQENVPLPSGPIVPVVVANEVKKVVQKRKGKGPSRNSIPVAVCFYQTPCPGSRKSHIRSRWA
ncbi:hypothetical protein EMCRGX_G005349 [Ephydatia muelleri]